MTIRAVRSGLLCLTVLTAGATLIAHNVQDSPVRAPAQLAEAFDPRLAGVTTLDEAAAVVSASLDPSRPRSDSAVAAAIDGFLRQRFFHGYSEYTLHQNWIAHLAGYVWDDLRAPVDPEHILDYPNAACSQQAMVFQALLRRFGIEYGSVTLPGHFAVAARIDGSWMFFDSNVEPVTPAMVPVSDVLRGVGIDRMYARRPVIAQRFDSAVKLGRVRLVDVDRYPAPRARLFHRATAFLSSFGWLLLGCLFLAIRPLADGRLRLRAHAPARRDAVAMPAPLADPVLGDL